MTNILIPYIVPLLLGRTIDLTTYQPLYAAPIFESSEYNETPVHNFSTTYHVLQGDRYPYAFLNHPVDMGILSKANSLPRTTMSTLVNDVYWKYKSAVVAIKSIYRTVNRSLKDDLPQHVYDERTDNRMLQSQTHYVNSISYGGYAYIFYEIDCSNPADVEMVRRIVTKELGVEGAFTNEIAEKLEKVIDAIKTDKSIRGNVLNHPQIVSSIPSFLNLFGTPTELLENINRIPAEVGDQGTGLYMEMKPLRDIDHKYRAVKYHPEMISVLEKVDEMNDDVKIAKNSFRALEQKHWSNNDAAGRIDQMLKHLKKCQAAFSQITYTVSLFNEINNDTLNTALQLYHEGLDLVESSYNIAYMRMDEDFANCEDKFQPQVQGILKVYVDEMQKKGRVEGGIEECKELCLAETRCRSIGYVEEVFRHDPTTGKDVRKEKLCWIYFRSTGTSTVYSPDDLQGDFLLYDRYCK